MKRFEKAVQNSQQKEVGVSMALNFDAWFVVPSSHST